MGKFELFRDYRRVDSPTVSITRYGQLSFSEGAKREFNIGDYRFCRLHFDREDRRVGIELTNDDKLEGVRAIRHSRTGSTVSARNFLKFYKIDFKVTRVFDLAKGKETGFLVFKLDEGRERQTQRRK